MEKLEAVFWGTASIVVATKNICRNAVGPGQWGWWANSRESPGVPSMAIGRGQGKQVNPGEWLHSAELVPQGGHPIGVGVGSEDSNVMRGKIHPSIQSISSCLTALNPPGREYLVWGTGQKS